jgi:hypothetical protein
MIVDLSCVEHFVYESARQKKSKAKLLVLVYVIMHVTIPLRVVIISSLHKITNIARLLPQNGHNAPPRFGA